VIDYGFRAMGSERATCSSMPAVLVMAIGEDVRGVEGLKWHGGPRLWFMVKSSKLLFHRSATPFVLKTLIGDQQVVRYSSRVMVQSTANGTMLP
jgi:hypothetical protein